MDDQNSPQFNILIVDDTQANLFMLERVLLQISGIQVFKAGSGREALALVQEHEFALSIIDVEMPAPNGYELVEILRQNPTTAQLPVIFLSAIYAEEYRHRKEFDAGPVDLMTKPIQIDLLISKVQVFVRLHKQRAMIKAFESNLNQSNGVESHEINRVVDGVVESWARALELREFGVEGHNRRVCVLTLRMAHILGIDASEQVHIRRGALLHDVGKMVVPDYILSKPGPLNEEERRIMQRHPVFAYELLRTNEILIPALDIPYCHHERWDGTGYPRRLQGTEIPLAARIFSIADVWDSLGLDRSYRPAWSKVEAIAYLKRNAKAEFDPDLVDLFLKFNKFLD